MRKGSTCDAQNGSVVLAAMCFVAVLGIVLASYMSVSSQAMRLSNRSYLKSVSEQLAESGLEQALWAFNRNNWDPTKWTVSGPTAERTITFTDTKYGNGATGSIRLRVNNYDSPSLATEWNSSESYATNVVVSYTGVLPWNGAIAYAVDSLASEAGARYRCIVANTGYMPPNPTYWTPSYDVISWYRCVKTHTNKPPPNTTYWESATPEIYSEGEVSSPSDGNSKLKTQVHAVVATVPLFPNAAAATSTLTLNAGGTVDSYNSDQDYDPATVATLPSTSGYSAVLAAGKTSGTALTLTNNKVQGYVAAASSSSPPFAPLLTVGGSSSLKQDTGTVISPHATAPNVDLTRISRSPFIPQFDPAIWDGSTGYKINDVVRYPDSSGYLYLCKIAPPAHEAPGNTTYWTQSVYQGPTVAAGTLGVAGSKKIFSADNVILNDGETLSIEGPVILDLSGELKIRGSGRIQIQPDASAEIHVSGRISVGSITAAADGFENKTKDPQKLILIGTVASSPYTNRYWSTLPFYGVIYMPKITAALDLYADTTSAIFGAVSAKSVRFPSAANLHYDTSLRTAVFSGLDAPYIITNWRELTDPAEKIVFP